MKIAIVTGASSGIGMEFVKMIDEKDFTRAKKMQEISLITIEIATKARQSAGIEFAADK